MWFFCEAILFGCPRVTVVREMGILEHTSNYQKCIRKTSKIPDYARNYRNEYLFIRGIDKACENYLKRLDKEGEIFDRPQANKLKLYFNRFLKAEELEYLNDITKISLNYKDIKSIEILELILDDYRDLYCDLDSFEFDQGKYDNEVENDYPGFKEFFECFSRFNDKLNVDQMSEEEYYKSIISDSDSDDEIDYRYSDSDSEDSETDSD